MRVEIGEVYCNEGTNRSGEKRRIVTALESLGELE